MAKPRVTIGFVPRESFSQTRRCLEALYARTEEPFQLVCVDPASPPIVQHYLEQAAREKGFRLIRTENFVFPNEARNLVLEHVDTNYVVFVDNDALVAPGWLKALVRCADETGAWVVGPLYFEGEPERVNLHMSGGTCRIVELPDGRRSFVERHDHAHVKASSVRAPLVRHETELIEFHTVLVSMQAFAALGPLDPALTISEHADLCLQVRATGKSVFIEPTAAISYLVPVCASHLDYDYFHFRWNAQSIERSIARLIEKYRLAEDDPEMSALRDWVNKQRSRMPPGRRWVPNIARRWYRIATGRKQYAPKGGLYAYSNVS
jgi:GT2 family glycosyltransferase